MSATAATPAPTATASARRAGPNDARIPALAAWGLDVVPGHDPADDGWRARWRAWADAVIGLRVDLLTAAEADPAVRAEVWALAAADPGFFCAIFCWIEEPRIRKGEDIIKPFACFAFQVEVLYWVKERIESGEGHDCFISKARGLGGTWILCALVLWAWFFTQWTFLLVSRKEALVDKALSRASMFGKIDFMLDHMPRWTLPAGFDRDEHRMRGEFLNPGTGALVSGEATTTKTARGNRATAVVYDEAAFIPSFAATFATGAGTTDVRVAISTESFEEGRDWWNAWHAALEIDPASVMQLDWWHNPYHDADWERVTRTRKFAADPEGFETEYLRNPWSSKGQVYPMARDCPLTELGYVPGEPLFAAIDPGRADDTAIVFAQWHEDERWTQRGIRIVDTYERNLMPAEWYAHVLTGIPPQPGDKCWPIRPDRRDLEVMDWLLGVPPHLLTVFMDPAGTQKDMSGASFYDRIVRTTPKLRAAHNERLRAELPEPKRRDRLDDDRDDRIPGLVAERPVVPLYAELFSRNRHDTRRLGAREWLLRTAFTDVPHPLRLKEALLGMVFSEPSPKATGEPAPLHNEWSHLSSAYEYLVIYLGLNYGTAPARPADDDARGPARLFGRRPLHLGARA